MAVRVVIAAGLCAAMSNAYDVEIVSDLVTTQVDEKRALDIKREDFWQPVLNAAEDTKMASAYTHLAVYEAVESAVAALPSENKHVGDLLGNALRLLKRADSNVFQEALTASEVANQQLTASPDAGIGTPFSFLKGGQDYFTSAIRRFIDFGSYADRVGRQVRGRQAEITPVLRGTAKVAGNVLSDCREASKLAFDVLKYDIYTPGVPKTPEALKKAANELIDAVSESRRNFLQGVTSAASSIAMDSEEKDAAPAATVTKSHMRVLSSPSQSEATGIIVDV